MEFLCILTGVLAVVALVGHGLWALVAWVFRGFRTAREAWLQDPDVLQRVLAHRRRCPHCRTWGPADAPACPECGLPFRAATELGDIASALRELNRLREEQALPEAVYRPAVWALEQRHATILGRPAAPRLPAEQPPAAVPVPVPEKAAPPIPTPIIEAPPPPAPEPVIPVVPVLEEVRPAPAPAPPPRPAPPPPAPVPPPEPPPPRRTLAEVLAAFLEERNIVWGEITGGLLMVGCSIALVIYLWQTQRDEIRLLPFLTFAGLTGLLFGLGLYAHRHWRLESTSRGLLVIATLMVPLDFLVLAGLTEAAGFNPFESGVKLVSLVVFALLTERAGRVIVAGGSGVPSAAATPLLLAVTACSAVMLLIPRLLPLGEAVGDGPLGLLGAGPVLAYGLGVGLEMRRRRDTGDVARAAGGLLAFVGLAGFALATALGFLLFRAAEADGVGPALERLAALVPLAGAPVLAAGLFAQRRLANDPAAGKLATLATAVAGAAVAVLLAAPALAWPRPGTIVAAGLIDFALFTALAVRLRAPWAHGPALAALAVAGAVAGPWLAGGAPEAGRSAWLLREAMSGVNGAALAGLVAALVLAGEGWKALARSAEARVYLAGAGVVALVSLALVALRTETEPARAAWVAGAYTLGCWVLARRERLPLLAQAGSLTLLVTTVAALHALRPGDLPLLAVVLAAEALAFAAAVPAWQPAAALAGLLAAAALAAFGTWPGPWVQTAAGVLLTAAAWAWAGRVRSAALAWLGSALLVLTLTQAQILLPHGPDRPLLTALLLTATLLTVADRLGNRLGALRPALWESAAAATLAAVPLFVLGIDRGNLAASAGYAGWFAGLWLAASLRDRVPGWFAAAQAALAGAVLLAVAAWLGPSANYLDRANLPTFTAGLAGLVVCSEMIRLGLRRSAAARSLLESFWPLLFDRLLLLALVFGHLKLSVELPVGEGATGMAWLTLGLLTLAVVAAVWQRHTIEALPGAALILILLGLSVPVLVTDSLADQRTAVGFMLSGVTLAGLVMTVPVWARGWLVGVLYRLGFRPVEPGFVGDHLREFRWFITGMLLVATAGLPVVMIVFASAESLVRPADPDTLIARSGLTSLFFVPLTLVTLTLTGHALRERMAGFALAAGLIANLLVTGGYGLSVVLGGGPAGAALVAALVLRFTLTAAAWAVGWRLTSAVERREEAPSPPWLVQLGLAAVPLAGLLVVAVAELTLPLPADWTGPFARAYPPATALTAAAAGWLGWLALGLTAAAASLFHRRDALALRTALGSLGVLALAACTLAAIGPGWGYRALLIGGAAVVVAWSALARWWLPGLGGWVAGLAAAVGLLATKAALTHGDAVPAAVVLAVVAAAAGRLAQAWRRDAATFAAGLGFHLAVSLLLIDSLRARPFEEWFIPLLQANAAVAAAVALDWLRPRDLARRPTVWLMLPVALAVILDVAFLLRPLVDLVTSPEGPGPALAGAGTWGGAAALVLTLAALLLYGRRAEAAVRPFAWGFFGVAGGAWAACAVAPLDPGGLWRSYHVLLVLWTVAGGVALWRERSPWRPWVHAFGVAVVALAIRAATDDPLRSWFIDFPAAAVLAVTGFAVGLALRQRWRTHVVASGLLLALAGLLLRAEWGPHTPAGLVATVGLGLTAAALGWAGIDRSLSRPYRQAAVIVTLLSVGWVAVVLVSGVVLSGEPVVGERFVWAAWAVTVAAALAGLRDAGAVWPLPSLFAAGLIGVALGWVEMGLAGPALARWAAVTLAGYVAMTAELAWAAARSSPMWPSLSAAGVAGVERSEPPDEAGPSGGSLRSTPATQTGIATQRGAFDWLVPAELPVAAAAILLSLAVALAPGDPMRRLAAPGAVALLAAAGVFLVGRGERLGQSIRGTRALAYATLALGALGLAELGWALQHDAAPAPWLRRTVALVEALAAATVAAGFGLPRLRGTVWPAVGRSAGPVFGLLAAVVVVAAVLQEGRLFDPPTGHTPLGPFEVGLVAAALAGLIAAALTFAINPGTDPFGLTERRRTLYVYGSEVLFLLLFLHTRFNVPALFSVRRPADGPPVTVVSQFWPFLVMAFAFAVVGLGELFRRRKLAVLADPLLRTGIFLPLLPLVMYWLQPPAGLREQWGESFPGAVPLLRGLDHLRESPSLYASLWFLFSLLYAGLAATRRSFAFSLAAALAANFGLWVLLAHYGVAFLAHPQVWLIPLALIVLVSEAVNRDRLGPEAAATLRYVGLGLLYLSSTADLFITGLGESVLLPIALAVLAVLGVLTGIVMRVRAYVYLGTAFLGLVVVSMIWHAAVDTGRTWVWWVSGIVLGAAILTLFALFEKRRQQVERAVEEFRSWR